MPRVPTPACAAAAAGDCDAAGSGSESDGGPGGASTAPHQVPRREEGAGGLLVAIGYKEFAAYFDACRDPGVAPGERTQLLAACVAELKQVTRRWVAAFLSACLHRCRLALCD